MTAQNRQIWSFLCGACGACVALPEMRVHPQLVLPPGWSRFVGALDGPVWDLCDDYDCKELAAMMRGMGVTEDK